MEREVPVLLENHLREIGSLGGSLYSVGLAFGVLCGDQSVPRSIPQRDRRLDGFRCRRMAGQEAFGFAPGLLCRDGHSGRSHGELATGPNFAQSHREHRKFRCRTGKTDRATLHMGRREPRGDALWLARLWIGNFSRRCPTLPSPILRGLVLPCREPSGRDGCDFRIPRFACRISRIGRLGPMFAWNLSHGTVSRVFATPSRRCVFSLEPSPPCLHRFRLDPTRSLCPKCAVPWRHPRWLRRIAASLSPY